MMRPRDGDHDSDGLPAAGVESTMTGFSIHQHIAAFAPPSWLRNAHVQSMFNNFPWIRAGTLRRAQILLQHAEAHLLDCGDGVRLLGFHSSQAAAGRSRSRGLVVLLHGWEGSAESTYVLSLGAALFAHGYDVFRLNFRDHGPSHHLNRELFHSCRLDEVVGAVRRIHESFTPSRMHLAGFSLGGNFALRVAVRAPTAGIPLHSVVAVCPALNPHATMRRLESGPAIYRQYFMKKWRHSLRLKQRHFPGHYDLGDILHCASITEMTECLVQRYTDISGLDAYLNGYALVGETLQSLTVPSAILASEDDPIIPAVDLARVARNPQLAVYRTQFGGHCGFMNRWRGQRWVDDVVVRLLEAPLVSLGAR